MIESYLEHFYDQEVYVYRVQYQLIANNTYYRDLFDTRIAASPIRILLEIMGVLHLYSAKFWVLQTFMSRFSHTPSAALCNLSMFPLHWLVPFPYNSITARFCQGITICDRCPVQPGNPLFTLFSTAEDTAHYRAWHEFGNSHYNTEQARTEKGVSICNMTPERVACQTYKMIHSTFPHYSFFHPLGLLEKHKQENTS